jgi:hypothetical protein
MTRAGSNTITIAHRAIKYHGHLICNPYDTSTKTALVIALFTIPEPLLRARANSPLQIPLALE